MAEAIRIQGSNETGLKKPISKVQRRGLIGEILNFVAKFAFDSTFDSFPKLSNGIKHINKVEQEELKEDPFPLLPFSEKNKARDFKLMMEKKRQDDMNNIEKQHNISAANNVRESEALKKSSYENMLAKMEKIQGGVNDLKQQDKVSTKPVEELESSKKKPEEDMKAYDLQENKKMVFIRSRL
ncbi:hypothetical protein CsatB_014332 [Cannabis sativa]|uniref:Uncharacterized protein n=2 Tax=Cannabis sativa TaxID=3483 RepID=A0AB40E933_CANSA|nr:uncharacterized protein LOC115695717 [Cannabis sativa]KAF4370523.1 hypothetical protein G4B88_021702 [Cannabis sativa]